MLIIRNLYIVQINLKSEIIFAIDSADEFFNKNETALLSKFARYIKLLNYNLSCIINLEFNNHFL